MAEIRPKTISCDRGHYYDANRYDKCPYCNPGSFPPTVDPFSSAGRTDAPPTAEGFGTTEPVGSDPGGYGGGSFQRTVDPDQWTGGTSDKMGKTQFVDTDTPAGAPSPVVGWLVAVEGPCRGTDYRIHTGYNSIGRKSGDICIRGDNTISAQRDATVTYVPQTRQFYIAHEMGKNVLLLNDTPVIGGSAQLHNYDRITIGNTKLVFVGLCGERFSWSGADAEHG